MSASPVERRDAAQHADFIQNAVGERLHQFVIVACAKFAKDFQSGYVMVKGFIEHAAKRLKAESLRIANEAQSALSKPLTASVAAEFLVAVQSVLLGSLHQV